MDEDGVRGGDWVVRQVDGVGLVGVVAAGAGAGDGDGVVGAQFAELGEGGLQAVGDGR